MKFLHTFAFVLFLSSVGFASAAREDEVTTHTGTGKTSETACKAARQLASGDGVTGGECRCQFNGRVHICMSDSIVAHDGSRAVSVVEFTPIKPGARVVKAKPSRPAQCDDLVKYRDTDLVSDIDAAMKRFTAARDSLDVLRPLRQEVKRAKLLNPTVDAAHKLTLELKRSANLVSDLLGMMPAAEAAAKGARGFAAIALSKNTERNVAFSMTGEVDSWLAAEIIGMVPTIGSGLKAFYNFADNSAAIEMNQAESSATIDAIDRNLAQVERLLQKQEALLNDSRTQTKLINKVKADIDLKCS